jgi:hypothetical protein
VTRVEWYPPDGGPTLEIRTGRDARYRLHDLLGVAGVPVEIASQAAPGQRGATLTGYDPIPRVVTAIVDIRARSIEEAEVERARMAGLLALSLDPFLPPAEGVLRVYRSDSLPPVEVFAVPQGEAPRRSGRVGVNVWRYEIDWWCGYPYWRHVTPQRVTLRQANGAGLRAPLRAPLRALGSNVEQTIAVPAEHVSVSPLIRMHGEFTTGRAVLKTDRGETVATLQVNGAVPAGAYVELNTRQGNKSATLVAVDGSRTDVMGRIDLSVSDFSRWRLRRGAQRVAFEANVNASGWAELLYHPELAGI